MTSNNQGTKNQTFKEPNFKVCPCCKSKDLVKFDVDLFCMNCDWNSILFDVYSGNFEKRIALMYQKPQSEKPIRSKSKLVHLPSVDDTKDEDENVA